MYRSLIVVTVLLWLHCRYVPGFSAYIYPIRYRICGVRRLFDPRAAHFVASCPCTLFHSSFSPILRSVTPTTGCPWSVKRIVLDVSADLPASHSALSGISPHSPQTLYRPASRLPIYVSARYASPIHGRSIHFCHVLRLTRLVLVAQVFPAFHLPSAILYCCIQSPCAVVSFSVLFSRSQ